MTVSTSCITTGLQPYIPTSQSPWNELRIRHAYRRIGYDANQSMISNALSLSPSQLIDQLIDESLNAPDWPQPSWSNFTLQDYENMGLNISEETDANNLEIILEVMNQMQTIGLKGRLILFWSNHFVTRLESYQTSNHMYEYFHTLEQYGLGNFQDFTRAIGKTGAMLIFLNGFENTSNSPNENYARELYELFTLGLDNGYTQQDIVETSKALTGYNLRDDVTSPIFFDDTTFDNSNKLIFGQEGNWNHDDAIDILFQERGPQIANFICKKLYKYFVSATVNEDVVTDMANIFVQDFNIANVLRTLFKSQHFFDSKTIGIQIKSPYDMTLSFLKITGFSLQPDFHRTLPWINLSLGQDLFSPVDVAGWQGDRDWINTSSLTGRWEFMQWILWHTWENFSEELRTFAIESSNNSNDPYVVTKSIIDRFIPTELFSPEEYQTATDVLKNDLPENYFENGIWNLDFQHIHYQLLLLFLHLITIPEFQLK
jgi:hypothetical protein